MSIDCRGSSWPLSVIVNPGEMGWWQKSMWLGKNGRWICARSLGRHWDNWNGLLNVQVHLPKQCGVSASVLEAGCGINLWNMFPCSYGWMGSLAELSLILGVSGILSSGHLRLLRVASAYLPISPGHWVLPQTAGTPDISLSPLPWDLCPLRLSLFCGVKNGTFLPHAGSSWYRGWGRGAGASFSSQNLEMQ